MRWLVPMSRSLKGFISRVEDNALQFRVDFDDNLQVNLKLIRVVE